MTDFRTFLSGLVAVFLALGLGMLIGSALIRLPTPTQQQQDLRTLQRSFADFSERFADLRGEADSLKDRLRRSDDAFRETMGPHIAGRLAGWRVSVVLCGELDDSTLLKDLDAALEKAGATRTNTTRVADAWIPVNAEDRARLAADLGVQVNRAGDEDLARAAGKFIVEGLPGPLQRASRTASGLRLDGEYDKKPHGVLLVSGTRTRDRRDAAMTDATPETGLLEGLRRGDARIVVAEPDGPDDLATVGHWSGVAQATVDNVDMASGLLSAIFGLADRDGHFGLRRGAERAIPELQ